MAKRVALSNEVTNIDEYAYHHNDLENAIELYFNTHLGMNSGRFIGYSKEEVRSLRQERIDEINRASVFAIITAIEGAFKQDFLQRCYKKKKDRVSREFRQIHKIKGAKVSFEREILTCWQKNFPNLKTLFDTLKRVLNYRHWLAHGRYWEPKYRFEFDFVYNLAVALFEEVPLIS